MSEQEAFEEAKRRWGKNAHVRYRQGQIPQGEKPYAVGQWVGHDFRMRGQGESWEEAFENADRLGKP